MHGRASTGLSTNGVCSISLPSPFALSLSKGERRYGNGLFSTACFDTYNPLQCAAMSTFAQYRREYEAMVTRLEAEYQHLTPQEKSRRVLGRDNPLLYSSQAVAPNMRTRGLSSHVVAREVGRQTSQLESIAHHTLVRIPLRRLPLPEARWIFLDFTGQAGGWRYRRAEAVNKFCAAIAGKPPDVTCRFLSGGIATSDLLDRLLLEEFSQPGAALRTTAKKISCRFFLWVAQSRNEIPTGTCVQIV